MFGFHLSSLEKHKIINIFLIIVLNSEPMDTGTEDGEEEKSNDRDLGVKLPLAPPGKCSAQLQVL